MRKPRGYKQFAVRYSQDRDLLSWCLLMRFYHQIHTQEGGWSQTPGSESEQGPEQRSLEMELRVSVVQDKLHSIGSI